ncbi:E3 ubiquitin-protein ligase NEURL3-like [Cololabis saira]|uniref:E3 ubiquitin-protein ligase NEURL3-like n=1 Tax=Cololabis saira TaxID=129043 RepID=UPI002AD46440|nr:E3 ubiquitin-protein ligase NEURL3-like [Cololabis saira]
MTCALPLKASRHSRFTTNLPRDRPEQNFTQDTMKFFDSNENPVPGTDMQHICSSHCLGPLAFHNQAVGEKIQLSQGCRLAKRAGNTFRNGMVFSNRPVGIRERICLRVLENVHKWEGALRVGFTSLPPTDRNLPVPSMAIPDLTKRPGHWAAPLPESYCQAGSELEFWVSAGGSLRFSDKNNREHKLLTGLDLSKPLWFMIDIYGQASSIFLLGSQKKGKLCTQKSCPAPGPESLTIPDNGYDHSWNPDVSSLSGHSEDSISSLIINIPPGESCVACLTKEATVTLPCAHKCLCHHCFPKVLQEFGTCPLCRTEIKASSAVEQRISV